MRTQSVQDPKPSARIQGHPDDPSSILDTTYHAPTGTTRNIEAELNALDTSGKSLEAGVNAHISARIISAQDEPASSEAAKSNAPEQNQEEPKEGPANLTQLYRSRRAQRKAMRMGTQMEQTYHPETILEKPPQASELDLPTLLANQTHLGHHTSLWHPGNSRYIFGIRDHIHIISLDTTFAHLRRAAKVVTEIARRGGIILFIGTRDGHREIVVNAAKLARPAYHIYDRWVPGTLTNGQQILGGCAVRVVDIHDHPLPNYTNLFADSNQHPVLKPDLVVCLNPIENEVCLHECGLHNVPTIGVVDTDCNPTWVTYPIPANDDSLRSIALVAGVLGRAGQDGQRARLETARLQRQATYDMKNVRDMIEQLQAGSATAGGARDGVQSRE